MDIALKLDKIYYEYFALAVLKDYNNSKFKHLRHGDSPDLKTKDIVGVEVTQLGTEQEFKFLALMNKLKNQKDITETDKTVLSECGYSIEDGMLVCTSKHDETNVYRIIESKINKLNNGNYNGFQENGLFMFLSETLENISVNDVLNIFKKYKDKKHLYDEIYILYSTDLYVYNLLTNKLDIANIQNKIKKYRNYAINKQRDYKEEKRRKTMRYYIADCHFGHANLNSKMDKRGFASVEEMDNYMIKQWNLRVRKNDEVVILGDFSFYNGSKTNEILKQLNGRKFLIEGNHDHHFLKDSNFDTRLIQWVKPYAEMNDNGRKVVASHYPNLFYNGQYRTLPNGTAKNYMLFGHIHITQDNELLHQILNLAESYRYDSEYRGNNANIPFNLINCFCMFSDYVPLTLDEWIIKWNQIRKQYKR